MKNKSTFSVILFIAVFFSLFLFWEEATATEIVPQNSGAILYVMPGANGNCTSWADACELQTALSYAVSGDQIWVAAGTYKPTSGTDRGVSFHLKTRVAIYGGFPTAGGLWSDRDWVTHTTTLSGDIGMPGDNNDNSYHVVTAAYADVTAILNGFTITAGNANGENYNRFGGGMSNDTGGRPTLTNLIFSDNFAVYCGGGMFNFGTGPTMTNVTFSDNLAGYSGGGMCNYEGYPILSNVTFAGNSAGSFGGGMSTGGGGPILTDVTFSNNTVTNVDVYSGYGGGMYIYISNPTLNNVTFSGNSATNRGGGLYSEEGSPSLTNVTFTGNSGGVFGGGMFCTGSYYNFTNVTFIDNSASQGGGMQVGEINMTNAILWGNEPDQIAGSPTITYSIVQGDYTGEGNIDADPLVGPLANNGGFTQTHALLEGSPAIDSGNLEFCPVIDQRGYFRPTDGNEDEIASCDIGAYEHASYPAVFSLTVDVVGNGSVTKNPDKAEYLWGEIVTLTPIADPDWLFIGWSDDASSSINPLNVMIHGDTNITANFVPLYYSLSLSVSPDDSGSVTAYPDLPIYTYGSQVYLTAEASPGWTFAGWSGDASGTHTTISVTMTDDLEITANFSFDQYSLSLSVEPNGMGTVTKSPIKPYYNYGDVITLTASTTITGWHFSNWSGDASGTTNPLTYTVVGNTNITANFSDQYTLSIMVNPTDSGTVTRDIIQDTYQYGSQVTLTAISNLGWTFIGWSGDATGSENPVTVTINGNTSIIANFSDQYTLSVELTPLGAGSVIIEPDQPTYSYGSQVTLTPVANLGWFFSGWSGDATGTNNPLTITITGDMNITANFDELFFIYLPIVLKD